ncbi:hypothetical protein ThvES_00001120 [Thiovulum sp. ES]|nr:hypothetical protein ThvES_00001120 [Thiovulum sp. ES]
MNLKPLFIWVKENGEGRAFDRVLMKSVIELIKFDTKVTVAELENSESYIIDENLFNILKKRVEQIVGEKFES